MNVKIRTSNLSFIAIGVFAYAAYWAYYELDYATRAGNLFGQGEYERAVTLLDQVIEKNPAAYDAVVTRGLARLYMGRPDAALAEIDSVLQSKPDDPLHAWPVQPSDCRKAIARG